MKFHLNEIFVYQCALLGRFALKVLLNNETTERYERYVQVLKEYCSIHESSTRGCRSLIDLRYFGTCRYMITFLSIDVHFWGVFH